ncbi:metal-dependent hydrolase [Ramlibacter alkalitolerans]|uniref:Metal-dependent hydrolase n=1 Tax=Ramlibacter alkalitolerans TaxID=2039631 RepID=A0ABS1JUD1_9BURK|nr:metal-dependent hydrolase [Ramlibacter alkalitolerans]MBL0427736.1 metal-dependent hydrolase [Ramlibacter alkalitolerans]
MTRTGHIATGWGAAALAYALAHRLGLSGLLPWIAAIGALPGVTAPDWMEIAWFDDKGWRKSVIPHRTWTHWLPLWALAFALCYFNVQQAWWVSAGLGFAVGGLTHLAMDVPNPTGIPISRPTRRRFSLRWWRSDQMVMPMVFLTWVAGAWALKASGALDSALAVFSA